MEKTMLPNTGESGLPTKSNLLLAGIFSFTLSPKLAGFSGCFSCQTKHSRVQGQVKHHSIFPIREKMKEINEIKETQTLSLLFLTHFLVQSLHLALQLLLLLLHLDLCLSQN